MAPEDSHEDELEHLSCEIERVAIVQTGEDSRESLLQPFGT